MSVRAACLLVSMVLGFPAHAQSSLGITGATFALGSAEDEGGVRRGSLTSSVDVRITEVHGLQGDLSFSQTGTGMIGRLSGHLYMAPQPRQKYGLFASYSDVDGRALAWGSVGAEGMMALGSDTVVEGRLGLGVANSGSRDFIFGGVSVAHAISDSFEIEGALDIADFDETAFRGTVIDASLTASYSPKGAPWGLYASINRSELVGRDSGPSATRLGLGVTINLGAVGGPGTDTRLFRSQDPAAALVRRGIW